MPALNHQTVPATPSTAFSTYRVPAARPQARKVDTHVYIDVRDRDGATALIRAAERGDAREIRYLLSQEADIDARDKNGWTALMKAARGGHLKAVADLISLGADPRAETRNGWNALSIAVKAGSPQVIALLAGATGKNGK